MKDIKILVKELESLNKEYNDIIEKYIDKTEELEIKKLEVIDPTKRDSVEKQLMAAMKDDENLQSLFLIVERLRRQKDQILKNIDIAKKLIDVNLLKDKNGD